MEVKMLDCATFEKLPLYRHKDLYWHNDEYQEHKFFEPKDFEMEKQLYELKIAGEDDYENRYRNALIDYASYPVWLFSDRYSTLDPNTSFFHNIELLRKMRESSSSYSEYLMKAAVHGIDEKHVRFELLYTFFARKRIFAVDYIEKNRLLKAYHRKLVGYDACDPSGDIDQVRWLCFREMCKEAFRDGHKNICSASEMMNRKLGESK